MPKFVKGQSGNPGGRSKKDRELEALAQQAMDRNNGDRNKAVERLMEIGMEGEHKDSINALALLMGYAYGKPRQRQEVKATFERNSLRDMTEAQLLAYINDDDEGDEAE